MTYAPPSQNVRVTGRRVVATILDGIVFGVISSILTTVFGTESDASGMNLTRLSSGGSIVLFLIVLAYYIVLEGSTGRTLGKMATGIKVVNEAGNLPGYGAATIRTLLRIIDGLIGYLVGFIIVLSSDRRRRLGDMAAKTQVVRA
nr:RDD family protein [uncultured Actinoplanes sp.]